MVVPALLPIAIAGVFGVYLSLGYDANPHGTGALFLILIAVTSTIAALLECVLVPLSLARLVGDASLRSKASIASVAFGAAFALLVAFGALYLHWRLG